MRWCIATIPMLLFALSLRRRGASPLLLSAALFATPMFLYSLLLFSHVLVGAALFGAYRLLFASEEPPAPREAALAGALAGVAVCSEFPAALAAALFGAVLVLRPGADQRARIASGLAYVAGGAPFAIGLAVYNAAIFGSPFSLSYAHETFQGWAEVASKGVFGIGWPTPANLWLLVASPSRGLLFYSPLLVLGFVTLFTLKGTDARRRTARLLAVLGGIILISGHGAAHGGWAAGPRYIVFVIPFLIEAVMEGAWFERRPALTGALLGASVLLSVLPALTFPFAPHEFTFPHPTLWRVFLLSEGWAAPTLGALVGLGAGWAALAPILIALGAVFAFALRPARASLVAGMAAGLVVATAYCFLPGLDDVDLELGRATIAERYFKPEQRLEAFRARAADRAQLRTLDEMRWLVADARAFAPDNWPYSTEPIAKGAPSSIQPQARRLQEAGRLAEAAQLYRDARKEYPVAQCKFTDQLAVILYMSGDKDGALSELEAARPVVAGTPSPDCCLVLFHLGSLYSERGRIPEARAALASYLEETEGDPSPVSARSRKEAVATLQRLEGH
jgi:tetratricopeptide (TPR) repeat protein